MHCAAWIRTDIHSAFTPAGYGPTDLQTAYGLTAYSVANGATQTIAIVDAFDNPNAESDLAAYRTTFALPPCTTVNGCFMRVNQNGVAANYPATDPTGGWESEEALDIEMASAICPLCEIVLVEANSNSSTDLFTAVDTAATTCAATVISNSWDGPEYNTETSDEVHFNHNIPITVASGDSGFSNAGDGYPVSSAFVTAVGGTTLPCPTCTETVWLGSGSDCSQFIAQPTWQTALGASYTSVCNRRIANDVSAIADPSTGVAVYDSFSGGAWQVFGGTSVATPIIASVYALAGMPGIKDGSYPYSHTGSFHDITTGTNDLGFGTVPCGATFMCTGEVGYDAPSGNGTPNGIGGF